MYRPTSTQKKGRANLYKHIGNVVKHSMSNPIKTSEEAREVFNTPPYYLTSKKNKQEKEKEEMNTTIKTPTDYQKLAARTCSIPYERKEDMLRHAVLGLNSEAGEVAGIFQKEYQGHEVKLDHLKKELGDCLWMIAEACTALNITMEEVMQLNIDKLRARFPEGFTAERSLHRAEGDI